MKETASIPYLQIILFFSMSIFLFFLIRGGINDDKICRPVRDNLEANCKLFCESKNYEYAAIGLDTKDGKCLLSSCSCLAITCEESGKIGGKIFKANCKTDWMQFNNEEFEG